ncbi:hypothetical protein PHLCEN_2v4119 [Hermanssonia centrifuga]|uniref:Uncharacterized protein n=1 Tax=Hermanssonia centrifuga TaxID=98765 RepID=A0A2R6Q2A4_9APHY|nr:hypothetical protein PHLCEN_2v4119 [Hermanssonia centrifuga]
MSAAAKAEARRQAILSRRSDRLAKLTTSARGEDAPAYMHDDPPLAPLPHASNLRQFVGEETSLPTPPAGSRRINNASSSSFAAAGLGNGTPDPSVWSAEQQQQLLNALMGGNMGPPPLPGQGQLPSTDSPIPPQDPLAALMAMMPPQGDQGAFGMPPGMPPPNMFGQAAAPPKKKTLLQKIMPLIHFAAAWILLTYFVLWKEPEVFDARTHGIASSDGRWRRWAELGWQNATDGLGVQFVPFFWAFTTLTIVLHSWRIFKGVDPIRPHMLVSLALPHLPPPLPSIILNVMKYLQIGSVFLDDIAALLFGVGLLVWLASWFIN